MKAIYWALVSCYAVDYAYTLKVIIIFNRVEEILKCYHSRVFVEEKKKLTTKQRNTGRAQQLSSKITIP